MARTKKQDSDETWGFYGKPPREGNGRTPAQLAELARATKLRTLWDMSEREIRALERFYDCPIIRPQRSGRGRVARGAVGPGV